MFSWGYALLIPPRQHYCDFGPGIERRLGGHGVYASGASRDDG